jgi:hypothetical protein
MLEGMFVERLEVTNDLSMEFELVNRIFHHGDSPAIG